MCEWCKRMYEVSGEVWGGVGRGEERCGGGCKKSVWKDVSGVEKCGKR